MNDDKKNTSSGVGITLIVLAAITLLPLYIYSAWEWWQSAA